MRIAGGQASIVLRLLRRFVERYAGGQPELRGPIDASTRAAVLAACHSLRGACGTAGMVTLSQALTALELQLDSAEALPPGAGEEARRIDDELVALVARLSKALGLAEPPPAG